MPIDPFSEKGFDENVSKLGPSYYPSEAKPAKYKEIRGWLTSKFS
jgi:hypothetical protein